MHHYIERTIRWCCCTLQPTEFALRCDAQVDVRDVAKLLVLLVEKPKGEQRVKACGASLQTKDLAAKLAEECAACARFARAYIVSIRHFLTLYSVNNTLFDTM